MPNNRIEMASRAVTLYSSFLNNKEFMFFEEYAENLRYFVIDEVSRYAPSYSGARNVGWVIRSTAFNRKELHNLVRDVYRCHKCKTEGIRVGSFFKCPSCEYQCHADYNGAMNILKRAMGLVSIVGAGLTQPGTRQR